MFHSPLMPSANRTRYYLTFRLAIPRCEEGSLRVTHPSAAKHILYCYSCNFARLACVKHAASVHSEPGSNSPVKLQLKNLSCSSALTQNSQAIFKKSFLSALTHRWHCPFFKDQMSIKTQKLPFIYFQDFEFPKMTEKLLSSFFWFFVYGRGVIISNDRD